MSARFELTDAEWELLHPLLPKDPPRGGRWGDHRTVISGILFRERTGILWRDLPARFGNWKTVYQRKRRWALDGTWQHIAAAALHLSLCSPNFLIMEAIERFDGVHAQFVDASFEWHGGYLMPPRRPGLGFNLREDIARSHAPQGPQPGTIRSY